MKGQGTIGKLVMLVIISVTVLPLLLISGILLPVWRTSCDVFSAITSPLMKNPCTKSPIQIDVIIKPEYLPLIADDALKSLLVSTDTGSGKQVQEILAYGVQNKNPTFSLDGKNVDLTKIIDEKMNVLLPGKQYELIVKSGLLTFGYEGLSQSLTGQNQVGELSIPTYKSSTTLTTPDLKKVQLVLFIR